MSDKQPKLPDLPAWFKLIQVVLAAGLAAFIRQLVHGANWFIQLLAFIVSFTLIYALLGLIYIRLSKEKK